MKYLDKVEEYKVSNKDTGYICAGTREDCWEYISYSSKCTRVAFGKVIEKETRVILAPSIKKMLNCKSLDFISPEVTHLSIPLPLISLVNSEKFPNLSNLAIENKEEYFDYFELDKCCLDANLKLKSLYFFGDCDKASRFWKNAKITLSNYPYLEYVNLLIEDISEIESILSMDSKIKHLDIIIQGTKAQDLPVLPSLISLSISINVEIKFNFEFSENNQLSSLYFRSKDSNIFDCKELLSLKRIEEIKFVGLKRLENPLALLEIQTLNQLTIINCHKPFRKSDINLFKQKNFKTLNIDNA